MALARNVALGRDSEWVLLTRTASTAAPFTSPDNLVSQRSLLQLFLSLF